MSEDNAEEKDQSASGSAGDARGAGSTDLACLLREIMVASNGEAEAHCG